MKNCCKCKCDKEDSYFLKSDVMCKTCFRKEVKYSKTCNKCKIRKDVINYDSDSRVCNSCLERDKNEIIENKRVCSKCSNELELSRFSSKSRICYDCVNKDRYKRIKDGVSKKYPNSKEKRKEWLDNNKGRITEYRKKYSNNKYKTDTNYKLKVTCRSFIRRCFCEKNGFRTYQILGYNTDKLKQRLEYQFTDKMNWENYGSYWNIDHKKPISLFEVGTPISVINALSNLKPVIKEENFSRGNKFKIC